MGDSGPTPAPKVHKSRLPLLFGGGVLLSVVGLAGLLGWHSLTDLDIWFHMRAGRDLLAGGGFPQVNTYAFSDPHHPWLNHEWLFQVLTVWTAPSSPLLDDLAPGWNGLRLSLILALASLLALGDGNLRRLRAGTATLSLSLTALVMLAGLLLLWPRFNLRPELLSYVFFVLLVRGAGWHYRRPEPANLWRDGSLWRLFGLVVIWAQCHGFAALGPVILLLAVIFRPLERDGGDHPSGLPPWSTRALWAPVVLALLALVLTPNHWRGLVFPLRALGQLSADTADLSETVSELVPLLATPNALGLTLTVFKLSLVWGTVFAALGWGRIGVLRIGLFGATAVAALASQRNIALYGLAFVMLHTGLQGVWPGPWCRRFLPWERFPSLPRAVPLVMASLLVAAGVVWWAPAIVSNDFYLAEGVGRRFGGGSTPAVFPRQAAAALPATQAPRTFANLDAAAFLLGTTDAHLFVDGRTEAYPKTRWAQYGVLRGGGPQALSLLDRNKVSAVVLSLGSGVFRELAGTLLDSGVWRPAAADAGGILLLPITQAVSPQNPDLFGAAARQLLAEPLPDPTRWADLCLAAADLQQLAGNTPGARHALTTGLAARPDHPVLNHNLGNLLLAEGEFSRALAHFQQALAVNNRLAGSALNAGVCQLRLQQPTAAVNSFRRSLHIKPDQLGGWVNLAVALRGTDRPDEAISALKKALALKPDDTRLQNLLRKWQQGR